MAKKQTRRSISVSKKTYERFRAFCERNDLKMSGVTDLLLNKHVDANARADAEMGIKTTDIVVPLDELDALRRAVMGDHFDSKLIDSAVHRIEQARERVAEASGG